MKGKKFYVLLFSLILVGIGSVYFYRQQEEQRVLEFEGYEISTIQDQVEALYNEDKTDIAQDISEVELEELGTIFEELNVQNLTRRNKNRIKELEDDFVMAREMVGTEKEVENVFVRTNVIEKDVTEDAIDNLELEVLVFENLTEYVDRNIELLAYARQQVVDIDRATEFIESLFDEEENVLETVSRGDEEKARELIEPIRNDEVKEELTDRIETVHVALTEREEQLAIEEALEEEAEEDEIEAVEEIEEELEEPPQYTAPPQQWTPPRNPGTGGNNGGEDSPAPPVESEPEEEDSESSDDSDETEQPQQPTPPEEPTDPDPEENEEDDTEQEDVPTENPTWEGQR